MNLEERLHGGDYRNGLKCLNSHWNKKRAERKKNTHTTTKINTMERRKKKATHSKEIKLHQRHTIDAVISNQWFISRLNAINVYNSLAVQLKINIMNRQKKARHTIPNERSERSKSEFYCSLDSFVSPMTFTAYAQCV